MTSPSRFFDHMANTVATAAKVIEDQAAALERVRKLHKSDNAEAYLEEYKEGNARCFECSERYPCATIKALDGDNAQA